MADIVSLEVLLHNETIGTIFHLPGDRNLFTFNTDLHAEIDPNVRDFDFQWIRKNQGILSE